MLSGLPIGGCRRTKERREKGKGTTSGAPSCQRIIRRIRRTRIIPLSVGTVFIIRPGEKPLATYLSGVCGVGNGNGLKPGQGYRVVGFRLMDLHIMKKGLLRRYP